MPLFLRGNRAAFLPLECVEEPLYDFQFISAEDDWD